MRACIEPLSNIGEVCAGADLARLIQPTLTLLDPPLRAHDVVVIAQKIVSKAENRFVDLDTVRPGPPAHELAARTGKDARLIEVILGESTEVLRAERNVLIVRHRLGHVMAQAGVDGSNVPTIDGRERVLLLPLDPQESAERLRAALAGMFGVAPGVIISDSFGRPWRLGTVNVALGAAGVPALWDRRGEKDRDGRELKATMVAWADAVAAAAGLAMGEAAEGVPAVLVRGLDWAAPEVPVSALLRPREEDLFR